MNTTPTQNQPDPRAMQAAREIDELISNWIRDHNTPCTLYDLAAIIQRVCFAGQTRDGLREAVQTNSKKLLMLVIPSLPSASQMPCSATEMLERRAAILTEHTLSAVAPFVTPAPPARSDPQAIAELQKSLADTRQKYRDGFDCVPFCELAGAVERLLPTISRLVEENNSLRQYCDAAGTRRSLTKELEAARAEVERLKSYLAGSPSAHVEAIFQLAQECGMGASSRPPVEFIRDQLATAQAERDEHRDNYQTLTSLLHKRFPMKDGVMPDYKVEDVLRENEDHTATKALRIAELEELYRRAEGEFKDWDKAEGAVQRYADADAWAYHEVYRLMGWRAAKLNTRQRLTQLEAHAERLAGALREIYDYDDGAWAAGKHHKEAAKQGRESMRGIAATALAAYRADKERK